MKKVTADVVAFNADHIEKHFWTKVNKNGPDPLPPFPGRPAATGCCWIWTASVRSNDGYGWFGLKKPGPGPVMAHILAYAVLVGVVPDGLELDHLCRRRECVNPQHLEPVTHAENNRRGAGFSGINARKETCIRGHSLTGANVYHEGASRKCLTCRRKNETRLREGYRSAVRKPKPSKEVLAAELAESSYMGVAGLYGVSDVAVKKWAKAYGLTSPKAFK